MGSRRLTLLSANIKPSRLLGAVLQVALLILPQQTVLAQVESKEYGATRVDFAISGGSGFVIKPNRSEPAALKPWVWYLAVEDDVWRVGGLLDRTRNRSLRNEAAGGIFGPSEMPKRKS